MTNPTERVARWLCAECHHSDTWDIEGSPPNEATKERWRGKATELLALLTGAGEPVGWRVQGYVHRGPDFSQGFQGWQVVAQPEPGIDVPVTLSEGHLAPPTSAAMDFVKEVARGPYLDSDPHSLLAQQSIRARAILKDMGESNA